MKITKKRNYSLKSKITISSFLVLTISIILLAIMSFNIINKKFENQVKEDGISLVEEIASEIQSNNTIMEQLDNLLGDKICAVAYLVGQHPNISNEYLSEVAKAVNVQEIDIADPSGVIIYSNLAVNIGYKYPENHPVQAVLQKRQSKIIEQIRKSTNEKDGNFYKYGAMTLSNGGIIQVGIIANEVKKLNQTVSNQNLVDRLGKKSNIVYALTIDPDLKTTAHSDKSRIGITLTDEGSKVAAQEGKMFSSLYNYKGQNVYDVLMPLKDNDTNLGAVDIGLSLENKNAAVKSVAISFTIVAILALIIGGFILRLIINSTLNPLNKLAQAAENVAQGHLTENIDIKSNDEIGNLGVSFNNMVLNLKNMVTKINDISTNLASSSKTLLISAEQVSKVSEEISNSTQEVAGGAEKQLKASKDVSSSMHNVVDDMGNITEQLSGIVKLSEDTSRLAADGREKMNSMVNQIETIKNSVNYTSNIVYELQKNSSEIGNIIEIMDGIADQTNLLALNASIEAARAGEAGRGFAVVADEVRKLAEESMKSSNSIKQLINDTQDRTNRALAAIEEGNRESEKGQELAEIVGQSLNEIIRSFENTKENLEKYNNMIINARNTIDNLDKSIQDIQVISTNTASSTEQVAASTEEQVSVLQEITGNIKKLAEMAADLEDSIKLFQV